MAPLFVAQPTASTKSFLRQEDVHSKPMRAGSGGLGGAPLAGFSQRKNKEKTKDQRTKERNKPKSWFKKNKEKTRFSQRSMDQTQTFNRFHPKKPGFSVSKARVLMEVPGSCFGFWFLVLGVYPKTVENPIISTRTFQPHGF